MDASYSYSPAGLTLGFEWELTATPKDSLLPLGPLATATNMLQFQPDSNGTFTLTVRATDGCRKSEITTFKVDTMCTQPEPAQEPTVTPVGPFVFDNSTFSYGYPTAQLTLDTKGYTFQSVVWELTLAALPSNAKQAAVRGGLFVRNVMTWGIRTQASWSTLQRLVSLAMNWVLEKANTDCLPYCAAAFVRCHLRLLSRTVVPRPASATSAGQACTP